MIPQVSSPTATPPRSEPGNFGKAIQNGLSAVLDVYHPGDTLRSVNIQGRSHLRIDISALQPGDICVVHLPRFTKTSTQLTIAFAQRLRELRLKRTPLDASARGSVNVIHAAIVLDVDVGKGTVRMAEASGRRHVCQGDWNFGDPQDPNAHIYAEAKYMFYRVYDAKVDKDAATPAERDSRLGRRIGELANKWTAAGGGYNKVGAALASFRRNTAGLVGSKKLVALAAQAGDEGAILDKHGVPESMFCSQFAGRVWGAAVVEDVLAKKGLAGHTNAQARKIAKHAFKLSPDALLPSTLHWYLDNASHVKSVGTIVTGPRVARPTGVKAWVGARAREFALRHGVQTSATEPSRPV